MSRIPKSSRKISQHTLITPTLLALFLVGILSSLLLSSSHVNATPPPNLSIHKVSSLEELKSILESPSPDNQNVQVLFDNDIVLSGDKEESIQIDGKWVEITTAGYTLSGSNLLTFHLQEGAQFQMKDASFKACKFILDHSQLRIDELSIISDINSDFGIIVENESRLELNGAIRNNKILSNSGKTPVIYINQGSEFVMNNGVIESNVHDMPAENRGQWIFGGAVTVNNNSHFIFNKGQIRENIAAFQTADSSAGESLTTNLGIGGAIAVVNGSVLEINSPEAIIEKNRAFNGGGVVVLRANMTLNGGIIRQNYLVLAKNQGVTKGGGICIFATVPDQVKLLAGEISQNDAGRLGLGGAIYLEAGDNTSPEAWAYLENLILRGNKSTGSFTSNSNFGPMGGGLWYCPSGSGDIHITKGCAIYDNTAAKPVDRPSSGDDLAVTPLESSKKSVILTTARRVLGGGEISWYRDGKPMSEYASDVNVPRYQPEDKPLESPDVEKLALTGPIALKSQILKESAKQLASVLSRLKIEDNTANVGGGIAVNGHIVIGEPSTYKIIVKKLWSEGSSSQAQTITAHLFVGEYEVADVVLNATNNWQTIIENFPDPRTLIDASGQVLELSIKEDPIPGFTMKNYQINIDNENHTIEVVLENKPEGSQETTPPSSSPSTVPSVTEGPTPTSVPSTNPSTPENMKPVQTTLLFPPHESETHLSQSLPPVTVQRTEPRVPVTGTSESVFLHLGASFLILSLFLMLLRHRHH